MKRRLATAVVVCLLAAWAAVPAGARTDDRTKPILYVHGYDSSGTTIGSNCSDYFDGTFTALESWGHTGERALVKYYRDDTSACNVDAHAHGSHSTHFAGGHSTGNGHTRDTSIRHLGYHLAWTIYHRYTSQGVTVDIVGHSMGGLISRYAVGATDVGDPDFPPSLAVEDVITVGTPHGRGLPGEQQRHLAVRRRPRPRGAAHGRRAGVREQVAGPGSESDLRAARLRAVLLRAVPLRVAPLPESHARAVAAILGDGPGSPGSIHSVPPGSAVRASSRRAWGSASRSGGRAGARLNRERNTPWQLSACASFSRPACTSGTRPAAGTRR